MIEKVIAYITQGDKLLVFTHPAYPEVGLQVPAGTVEDNESVEEAALREATEETGLRGLEVNSFLGVTNYDMVRHGRSEIQRRHFYHLRFNGETPSAWRHYERSPSDGGPPIEFEFYWAALTGEAPELFAGQGELLAKLR